MTAHILFGGERFPLETGETVLDCLSRNGVSVPHACRAGVCQSCLLHADEGSIPAEAQEGLKSTYRTQNLFLACQCRPLEDMRVSLPATDRFDTRAAIAGKDMLNASVLRLRLTTDAPFPCEPGQYLTLINGDGLARSYSIANDPAREGFIELHIRLLNDGLMSGYLRDARVGETVLIRGPAGQCFYVGGDGSDYPIVLAGTGTGLAPLYGILRRALGSGHTGQIRLFHGGLHEGDLYHVDALTELAAKHANFRYVPCVLEGSEQQFYTVGNIETVVVDGLPKERAATRVFLCGAPDLVNGLRRKTFLAGIASKHIFADAFLPSRSSGSAA